MTQIDIKFVVVGHHSRIEQACSLACSIGPASNMIIDEGYNGANAAHRRALEWASYQDCRVVILEDDALPVDGFKEKVADWLERFPADLCSFYLGTGRPPQYQLDIAMKLIESDKRQTDYITMNRLIHGVCYSPPPASISRILDRWDATKAADYAVGDAYGGQVIYPCWSLVDHADAETVERHPDAAPRTERRRAWRFNG